MAETEGAGSAKWDFRKEADCFCGSVRKAFEDAANAFRPPEEARRHFHQARVEVWKGIRELVDRRISHLDRDASKGSHVVVE
jgi:hypothetical protein